MQTVRAPTLSLSQIVTPIGPMLGGAIDEGICLLEFQDRQVVNDVAQSLSNQFTEQTSERAYQHLAQLEQELQEYFDTRKEFSVLVSLIGTEFQKAAWSALQAIPHGSTRTYLQQAKALHRPNSVRAVASANSANRIAIVIPCHRVIGTNGELTGYAGGLWRKRWLLDWEQANQRLF